MTTTKTMPETSPSTPLAQDMRGHIALIGAGPSGLAAARNLQKLGGPFQGFEAHTDVGGLWNIDNPRSTVYETAHLISSKHTTEFTESPRAPKRPTIRATGICANISSTLQSTLACASTTGLARACSGSSLWARALRRYGT